jgi:uncharacterized protein (DUF1810 family)
MKRFTDAQRNDYKQALAEIRNGRKVSHWMWYIFPQIGGLGFSETSRYYAIRDVDEAQAYIDDPILGPRLVEISSALLDLDTSNATKVFGSPDDVKLKSSMTLFSVLEHTNPVFQLVLDKFFNGEKDQQTLKLIKK